MFSLNDRIPQLFHINFDAILVYHFGFSLQAVFPITEQIQNTFTARSHFASNPFVPKEKGYISTTPKKCVFTNSQEF